MSGPHASRSRMRREKIMTASLPEREPEHPDVPFDSPPGVHEVEPDGDNAPAPDADTGGEPIGPDPIEYTGPGYPGGDAA